MGQSYLATMPLYVDARCSIIFEMDFRSSCRATNGHKHQLTTTAAHIPTTMATPRVHATLTAESKFVVSYAVRETTEKLRQAIKPERGCEVKVNRYTRRHSP